LGGPRPAAQGARSLFQVSCQHNRLKFVSLLIDGCFVSRFHKFHHEKQFPNILAASQFGLLDAIIETTSPVYIGCALAGSGSFLCHFFQAYFLTWVGTHNHCVSGLGNIFQVHSDQICRI
jgi:sterol desaturase/sphingolipid hydroxylase (fatty acid hydroxylase superfamily)